VKPVGQNNVLILENPAVRDRKRLRQLEYDVWFWNGPSLNELPRRRESPSVALRRTAFTQATWYRSGPGSARRLFSNFSVMPILEPRRHRSLLHHLLHGFYPRPCNLVVSSENGVPSPGGGSSGNAAATIGRNILRERYVGGVLPLGSTPSSRPGLAWMICHSGHLAQRKHRHA